MDFRKFLIFVLLVFISVLSLQGVSAANLSISVGDHSLVLPDNCSVVSGNGSSTVFVRDGWGDLFAVTNLSVGSYFGVSSGFHCVSTGGVNVTGFDSDDADIKCACLLYDDGSYLIVNLVDSGFGVPVNCTYLFGSQLQRVNGLYVASFTLSGLESDSGGSWDSDSGTSSFSSDDGGVDGLDNDNVPEDYGDDSYFDWEYY